MTNTDTPNDRTLALISVLMRQRFYGSVKLNMQNGQVVQIVKEQSLKPEQLTPNQSETGYVGNR